MKPTMMGTGLPKKPSFGHKAGGKVGLPKNPGKKPKGLRTPAVPPKGKRRKDVEVNPYDR